jgi:hypothetical protein
MLPPHERSLLLESLRPPAGYRLDRAVGTTFTLDLLTLLTTPLAFTFFDWEDSDGQPTADPLALLEALRRHAERISVFCHAGYISVPPPDQKLLAYLEGSVIEVQPRIKGALFHPKVWVLRFIADGEPVRYRVLCLSRNLTFDRSWDTALVLEGKLTKRRNAFGRNHPLGDFLATLPKLAVRRPEKGLRDAINNMQQEIRRVEFEIPPGFDEISFAPLGISGHRRLKIPRSAREMLVVSPFLSGKWLEQIRKQVAVAGIVSRPEAFQGIDPDLLTSASKKLWVMSPDSDLDSREGADDGETKPAELAGLHAKLFVVDEGWGARVWTGSANATDAAFGKNVEFLVELQGRKSRCGSNAFLGSDDDRNAFRSLLVPYTLHGTPETEDEQDAFCREMVRTARSALFGADLALQITPSDRDGLFEVSLVAKNKHVSKLTRSLRLFVRPITLRRGSDQALRFRASPLAKFQLSFEALTSFVAFRVVHEDEKIGDLDEFVVNLPLHGAPSDRGERILQSLLKDKGSVMRFLLLLLSDEELRVMDITQLADGESRTTKPFGRSATESLLESFLRALVRNPSSLAQVEKVIADLRKTPEGRAVLPDGLDEIWQPIWAAYKEVGR